MRKLLFVPLILTTFVRGTLAEDGLTRIQPLTMEHVGSKRIPAVPLNLNWLIEISVDETHSKETFPEDWLVLKVIDLKQKILATKSFYSSYQRFRVDIIDLDGDGQPEFLFHYGRG